MRVPKKKLLLYWLLIIILGTILQINISKENIKEINKEDDQRNPVSTNSTYLGVVDVVEMRDSSGISGINDLTTYKYIFSSMSIGFLFILLLATVYITTINSIELRDYIDSALNLAGFKGHLSKISRKISLENNVIIKIYGVHKIKIKIIAPLFDNILYFGLREELNKATTTTSLNSFPIKMIVIKQYLLSNKC